MSGNEWILPYTRSFQPEIHAPALRELAEQVTTASERLQSLSPKAFELFVGTVLRDFMNCEVRHVGGPGDNGIDLVVLDADPPLLVQVKRRERRESSEGIEVVKNMFASLFAAGRTRGMVVTSANRFTRGAKAWVRSPALVTAGFELDLVDFQRLIEMTRLPARMTDEPAWREADRLANTEIGKFRADVTEVTFSETLDRFAVQTPDGTYSFARPDRDCCSFAPLGTGAQNRRITTVESFEFVRLLRSWPSVVVDALVEFWSGPAREDLVEYEW